MDCCSHFIFLVPLSLIQTLSSCGWDVIRCHGGVSLVAKPTLYLGKAIKIDNFKATLDGTNIREALLKSTGLCINGGSWTRLPDYCRFIFSLDQTKFDQSLERIVQFKKMVLGD
jgi:methionine S-methyltransferase